MEKIINADKNNSLGQLVWFGLNAEAGFYASQSISSAVLTSSSISAISGVKFRVDNYLNIFRNWRQD